MGAGGHGKVVADIIQKSGDKVMGFLDDNLELPDMFMEIPVIGSVKKYKEYKEQAEFVVAIGNSVVREKIAKKMDGVKWYTAIHPTAVISNFEVQIAEGTVIMPNAVINSGSNIGKHCIINTSAVVEHDDKLADFVHISVGARIGGTVSIGKGTWIGIGASVSNNLDICDSCMVGAGAVVIKNISRAGIYIGVPAERMEMKKRATCVNEWGGVKPRKKCGAVLQYRRCAA